MFGVLQVHAIHTFNFLNSENRAVACALIPPAHVSDIDPEPVPPKNISSEGVPTKLREGPEVHKLLSSQRTLDHVANQLSAKTVSKPLQRSTSELLEDSQSDTEDSNTKKK